MVTIFTTPKAFTGHNKLIQENAIKSWTLLRPACEIILIGNDEGTAETAASLGLKHIPEIASNEYGTPLISAIFGSARKLAENDILCYVNADIILMNDFVEAVQRIIEVEKGKEFLMISQRWDLDVNESLVFGNGEWESELRTSLSEKGTLHAQTGIDYFLYSPGLFNEIPPFAIGRTAWDNWFVFKARASKADVIDATEVVSIVHQNHDYAHAVNGYSGAWKGPEAVENQRLAGDGASGFTIGNANFKLTKTGLERTSGLRYRYFELINLPLIDPRFRLLKLPLTIVNKTILFLRKITGSSGN